MSTQDLAFFLATHNYDVTPKEGYVELRLDGHVYKVTSNGDKPESWKGRIICQANEI